MSSYLKYIVYGALRKELMEEYGYEKVMDDLYNEMILGNCRESIQYFAEHFIKINHVRDGKRLIELNETQKYFLELYEKGENFCAYGNRQKGKTTLGLIILLHNAIFSEGSNFFIPCRSSQITDISDTLFQMYEDLPDFLKEMTHLYRKRRNLFEFRKHSGESSIEVCSTDYYTFAGKSLIRNVYFDEIEYARFLEISNSQISQIMMHNASVFSFSSSNAHLFFGDKIYV